MDLIWTLKKNKSLNRKIELAKWRKRKQLSSSGIRGKRVSNVCGWREKPLSFRVTRLPMAVHHRAVAADDGLCDSADLATGQTDRILWVTPWIPEPLQAADVCCGPRGRLTDAFCFFRPFYHHRIIDFLPLIHSDWTCELSMRLGQWKTCQRAQLRSAAATRNAHHRKQWVRTVFNSCWIPPSPS